jgi:hypothetical protein
MSSDRPHRLRVLRTLSNRQAGALKLAARYGDALICVRHRCDAHGTRRYTTVELIVDEATIQKRRPASSLVELRIPFGDQELRQRVMAHGGLWHPTRKTWHLTYAKTKALGVAHLIVKES